MIPAQVFRDWVKRFDLWREFVFDLLSDRLSTVLAVVDEVVFQRMDRRVASLLLAKSKTQHPIRVTHQEIAADRAARGSHQPSPEGYAACIDRIRPGTIAILDHLELENKSVM